jgi:hypothetical protein
MDIQPSGNSQRIVPEGKAIGGCAVFTTTGGACSLGTVYERTWSRRSSQPSKHALAVIVSTADLSFAPVIIIIWLLPERYLL